MAINTEGKRALADLAAGKFSFEMVDAIKDHVSALETELESVAARQDGAANELRQQAYVISRLEADLRKANASFYALMKANALTEFALRETKRGAVMLAEYLPVAGAHAAEGSKKALAYLSTVDLKAEFENIKGHPTTEKALRQIERLAIWVGDYLPVARKYAEEGSKKAMAYLATVDLKAGVEKLKALPLTEKALREIERLGLDARAHLPAARKQVAGAVEKASAYISHLHKKVA